MTEEKRRWRKKSCKMGRQKNVCLLNSVAGDVSTSEAGHLQSGVLGDGGRLLLHQRHSVDDHQPNPPWVSLGHPGKKHGRDQGLA